MDTLKLPKFWETAATGWFAQAEAQFNLRGITDDDARFYHVVASLDPPAAAKAQSFVANPPPTRKYAGLKAHLLKLFELSRPERARRLLNLPGLGDRKPSEHMEMMLNLLGDEEPGSLFRELFMGHLPQRVRTALANSTAITPRDLAAEADLCFVADQAPASELLAPVRARSPPRDGRRPTGATGESPGRKGGWCFYHALHGPKARKCRSPCTFQRAGNDNAHAQ